VKQNPLLTPAFSRQDVEISDCTQTHAGFLSLDRMTLKHRFFNGGWSGAVTREVVRRVPGVGVLLYDPELDMVLLVEQFRVGCLEAAGGPWKLELVAGLIDTGESPEQVAVRETREEANVDISTAGDRLLSITNYYLSPGSSTEYMHLYCARFDASRVARQPDNVFGLAEEHEDIRVVILSREEASEAIITGHIDNAMSIIALQWLALNLEEVRQSLAQ